MKAGAANPKVIDMKTVSVLVVVADETQRPMTPLVDRMKTAGLAVTSVMDDLGIVRGSIEDGKLAALKAVPGVVDVEEEEAVKLPPPNDPIQ